MVTQKKHVYVLKVDGDWYSETPWYFICNVLLKSPCQIARSILQSPMGSSLQTHQWDDLPVVLRRPQPRSSGLAQVMPFMGLGTTTTPRSQSQVPINPKNLILIPQVRFFLDLARTNRLACFQVQTHRRGGASGLREMWNHQASKSMTNTTTGRVVRGAPLPSKSND